MFLRDSWENVPCGCDKLEENTDIYLIFMTGWLSLSCCNDYTFGQTKVIWILPNELELN